MSITAREIAAHAIKTLDLQKRYFSTRDRADLIACKDAEKKLRDLATMAIVDSAGEESGAVVNTGYDMAQAEARVSGSGTTAKEDFITSLSQMVEAYDDDRVENPIMERAKALLRREGRS
jgi:hypothetical protein